MKRLTSGHSPQYVGYPSKRHRKSELSVHSEIVGAHCDQLSTASRFDSIVKGDFRSSEVPTGSSFSFQSARSQSQHPSGESGSPQLSSSVHGQAYNELPTSSNLSCFQPAMSQPQHPSGESGSPQLSSSVHGQTYNEVPTGSNLSCFQSGRSQSQHPSGESGSPQLSSSVHGQAYHKIHVNSGQHPSSHTYFHPFPLPGHYHRPALLSHGPWGHHRFSYSG